MTTRLRHAAYASAALPASLAVSLLAPLKGGPDPLWVALMAALAATTLVVAPRPGSMLKPVAGIGIGALFWGLATVIGGLTGGLGLTGVLFRPGGLVWLSLWTAFSAAAGAGIAWSVLEAWPRGSAPLAAAGVFWASQMSLGPLAFSSSPLSAFAWTVPSAALGLAGAVIMYRHGYWAGLGFLVSGRLLTAVAPIAGGVDAVSRSFAAVSAAALISLAAAPPVPSAGRRGLPKTLLAGVLLALTGLGAAWSAGARAVVVVSGSMEPSLGVGDIVVVMPEETVEPGDVVLYRHGGGLVIHRAISVGPEGIATKGDANPEPDPWLVDPGNVLGVMRLRIPKAGAPLLWLAGGGSG